MSDCCIVNVQWKQAGSQTPSCYWSSNHIILYIYIEFHLAGSWTVFCCTTLMEVSSRITSLL